MGGLGCGQAQECECGRVRPSEHVGGGRGSSTQSLVSARETMQADHFRRYDRKQPYRFNARFILAPTICHLDEILLCIGRCA
jgi:hypothetical protein